MAEQSKCRHSGCNCGGAEAGSDGFCSQACRDGQSKDGKCACGHSACK